MPRPNLKAERTEVILKAVEQAVIREGLNGATLEKIAEHAGMRRSLLRHNVGNRETLIETFLERFFQNSDTEMQQMLQYLPKTNRIPVLLNYLFDVEYANSQLALVALALTSAAASDPNIQLRLREWNRRHIEVFAKELQLSYTASSPEDCYEVATGLIGIYFNAESFAPLGDMTDVRSASKRAAARLLSTLENSNE